MLNTDFIENTYVDDDLGLLMSIDLDVNYNTYIKEEYENLSCVSVQSQKKTNNG